MSTPRHRTAPGCSYFVTTKCWQGRSVFQVSETAQIVVETLFHYRDRGAYSLHEFVLMPDHLHLLLTPSATTSLERALQFIKGGSSRRIHAERNQRMEIWQVGYYDWTVRSFSDWNAKVEYIRMNPVQSGLVPKPEDWPYSSANAQFAMDPPPEKFSQISSGAKALKIRSETLGLKPQPPEKASSRTGFRR